MPSSRPGGPLVFVDDLDAPELADDDRHHLERVLRLAQGSRVDASDGAGRWRPCVLASTFEPTGEIVRVPAPDPPLTVAFALIKGERPELIVQKLTEVGIDRIIPFVASRSIAHWDGARAAKHATRLRAVAKAASMQCLRTRLPEIADLSTFAEVSALEGAAMADRDGDPPALAHPVLLVGPEGGWSPEERACGLRTVGLGDHVLRAETAAIAGAAVLAALRAGIVASNHAR